MKTVQELTNEMLNEYDEKVIALAQYLDIDMEPDFDIDDYPSEDYTDEEIEQAMQEAVQNIADELDRITNDYENTYSYGREEYEVLTDAEADDRMEQQLDNYIEECIYPEIKDEYLRNYFDEDAWKSDARLDGRGHIISTYDGCENEEKVNDTWYYIYRQN